MTATVTPITETCFMCCGKKGCLDFISIGLDVVPQFVACPLCHGRGVLQSGAVKQMKLTRQLRARRKEHGE